jgi:hypothetical protein
VLARIQLTAAAPLDDPAISSLSGDCCSRPTIRKSAGPAPEQRYPCTANEPRCRCPGWCSARPLSDKTGHAEAAILGASRYGADTLADRRMQADSAPCEDARLPMQSRSGGSPPRPRWRAPTIRLPRSECRQRDSAARGVGRAKAIVRTAAAGRSRLGHCGRVGGSGDR